MAAMNPSAFLSVDGEPNPLGRAHGSVDKLAILPYCSGQYAFDDGYIGADVYRLDAIIFKPVLVANLARKGQRVRVTAHGG